MLIGCGRTESIPPGAVVMQPCPLLCRQALQGRSVLAGRPDGKLIHPRRPIAYAVNKLDSTVAIYDWNLEHGFLTPKQTLRSAPSSGTKNNRAAEIAVLTDGCHVYLSNRKHDGIVIVRVDATPGLLAPDSRASSC